MTAADSIPAQSKAASACSAFASEPITSAARLRLIPNQDMARARHYKYLMSLEYKLGLYYRILFQRIQATLVKILLLVLHRLARKRAPFEATLGCFMEG